MISEHDDRYGNIKERIVSSHYSWTKLFAFHTPFEEVFSRRSKLGNLNSRSIYKIFFRTSDPAANENEWTQKKRPHTSATTMALNLLLRSDSSSATSEKGSSSS